MSEELGQHEKEQEVIPKKFLETFGTILDDKLANVATKECIGQLNQTILNQQIKIQELEASGAY